MFIGMYCGILSKYVTKYTTEFRLRIFGRLIARSINLTNCIASHSTGTKFSNYIGIGNLLFFVVQNSVTLATLICRKLDVTGVAVCVVVFFCGAYFFSIVIIQHIQSAVCSEHRKCKLPRECFHKCYVRVFRK